MRRALPFTFFGLSFFLVTYYSHGQVLEVEPNNTITQANLLALMNNATGSIDSGDVDWWEVNTTGDGKLDLTIENFSESNSLQVQLSDSGAINGLHDTIIPGKSSLILHTDGLGAGKYLIKVAGAEASDKASYKLFTALIEPLEDNDQEPNNNLFEAKPIPLYGEVTGHYGYVTNGKTDVYDWYTFTTLEDGDIYFRFTNHSPYKIVRCILWDTIYNLAEVVAYPGKTEISYFKGVQAGKYYLQVSREYMPDAPFGTYTLYDSLAPEKIQNDTEPNNHKLDANNLPLNGSITGHTSFYYSASFDSTDWYKLTLPDDGLLKLYITNHSDINHSTRCFLYDNDGKTLLGKKLAFQNETRSIVLDGLSKGTYYLKIDDGSFDSFVYSAYTLTDSFFTYRFASDQNDEPNNRQYLAPETPLNTSIQSHVGFYYNKNRDSVDWRKHTYDGTSGNVLLAYNLESTLIDGSIKPLHVQLFLDTLSAPLLDTIFYEQYDTAVLTDLPKGVYYLRTSCENVNTDWSAYSAIAITKDHLPDPDIYFIVSQQHQQALLEWETSSSESCKGFYVQKSYNHVTFKDAGYVPVRSNQVIKNYSFVDKDIEENDIYYRIKQVDFKGGFKYSSTQKLITNLVNWQVLGNPVTSDTKLIVSLLKNASLTVQVANDNGAIVKTIDKGKLNKGSYTIPLNLAGLSKGVYTLKMLVNNDIYSEKLIK